METHTSINDVCDAFCVAFVKMTAEKNGKTPETSVTRCKTGKKYRWFGKTENVCICRVEFFDDKKK